MRARTENGKRPITGGAALAGTARKADRFDPVVDKWRDPEALSDRRLLKMICEDGGAQKCPQCESFDRCQYCRELVRRNRCKQQDGTQETKGPCSTPPW